MVVPAANDSAVMQQHSALRRRLPQAGPMPPNSNVTRKLSSQPHSKHWAFHPLFKHEFDKTGIVLLKRKA